jgi:hypothetical protein
MFKPLLATAHQMNEIIEKNRLKTVLKGIHNNYADETTNVFHKVIRDMSHGTSKEHDITEVWEVADDGFHKQFKNLATELGFTVEHHTDGRIVLSSVNPK